MSNGHIEEYDKLEQNNDQQKTVKSKKQPQNSPAKKKSTSGDRTKCRSMEKPHSIPLTQAKSHTTQGIKSGPLKSEIKISMNLSEEHPTLH